MMVLRTLCFFMRRMRIMGKYVGKSVRVCSGVKVSSRTSFEGHNYIGCGSSFNGNLGFGSYIGNDSSISAAVGRYCSIANNVKTINGFHPTEGYISTHPAFYSEINSVNLSYSGKNIFDEYRYADENRGLAVSIGNDVWIGQNANILAGVEIGDGAVIAAGAVVIRNVPPYAIVGGVPAKVIRYRFTEEQRAQLLELRWWDKDEAWIRENMPLMVNDEKFYEVVKKNRTGMI